MLAVLRVAHVVACWQVDESCTRYGGEKVFCNGSLLGKIAAGGREIL